MAQSLIRGSTQILSGSISVDRLVSGWDSNFIKRDGTAAATANIPLGGFRITGLADPVANTDAANLQTVLSFVNGISTKPAIRGVFIANVASLSGVPGANDGVTFVATNLVLLTAQTTASQNGPWIINAGAWTRPTWWSAASTQKPAQFFVTEGTTYHDTKWMVITDGDITVDTTNITVQQDASGVAYANGNGISLTGNVFAVKTGNGIAFDGSQNVTVTGNVTALVSVTASGVGLTNGTNAQMIVMNAGATAPVWVSMSGDVTIAASGAATINHTAGSGFLKYTDHVYNETPGGAVNGSNTAFTVVTAPQNTSLALYLNGQLLEGGAGNDYTISGTAITMLFIPQTGDKLRAYYTK